MSDVWKTISNIQEKIMSISDQIQRLAEHVTTLTNAVAKNNDSLDKLFEVCESETTRSNHTQNYVPFK